MIPIPAAAASLWLVMLVAALTNSVVLAVMVGLVIGLGAYCAFRLLVKVRPDKLTPFKLRQLLAISLLLATVGLLSFGFQSGVSRLDANQLKRIAYSSQTVELKLLDNPVAGGIGQPTTLHAELLRIDGKAPNCQVRFLAVIGCHPKALVSVSGSQTQLSAGSVFEASAFAKPGPPVGRYPLWLKVQDLRKIQPGGVVAALIDSIHERFQASLAGISSDSRALVAGIAIGASQGFPTDLKQAMKTTGLTHLTAVSGANLVIVVSLFALLLNRFKLGRGKRLMLNLMAIVAYVLLVGQQASVLRAGFMFAAVLIAKASGRRINPMDALGAAVGFLLLADPWLSIDLGFALSALATLGLLVLARPIETKVAGSLRVAPKWLTQGVAVILAAQVFCLPIIVSVSGSFPIYSIPANLIAEPLVTPITVMGLIAVLISPWSTQLASGVSWIASIPADWIAGTAHFFASVPLAKFAWPAGWVGVGLALLITASGVRQLFSKTRSRFELFALVAACAVGISFGLAKPVVGLVWPSKDWVVVNCDVGQGDALVIRSQGQVAVVDVGKTDTAIDECLQNLHISTIDLLVLTHFDMDHVGGLAGALSRRRVSIIMETPWPDSRPSATWIRSTAAASGAQVILAESGLQGRVGAFRWQVLNPTRTAEEAEDSNDGSIAMAWFSPELNLLTLADLGEKGQMRVIENFPQLISQLRVRPVILKVAHHGSADCYTELYEDLHADVALISVGKNNGYGHPTKRALSALEFAGTKAFRTDLEGAIAVAMAGGVPTVSVSGGG